MAATTFNLASDTNFDTLQGATLAGADIININGAILTVDTDTRFCASHKHIMGSIGTGASLNISTALGGQLKIDGSNCKMIPYVGGSGLLQPQSSDAGGFATAATWTGGIATIAASTLTVSVTTSSTTVTRAAGSFITDGFQVGMTMFTIVGGIMLPNTIINTVSALTLGVSQTLPTVASAANATFNYAAAPVWVTGNRVTIANAIPAAWNGTYDVVTGGTGSCTVAIAADPGAIIQMPTVQRRYMVTQALPNTPASIASYTITGAGPYLVTVNLPDHGFNTGNTVVVAGVTNSGTTMNGSWTITRIDNDTCSFSMPTNPGTVSVAGTLTKTVKAEQVSVWGQVTSPITGYTIGAAVGGGYVCTVTVPHTFQPGDLVNISGNAAAAGNGTYMVNTVTSTTAFTYFRVDTFTPTTTGGVCSVASRQLNATNTVVSCTWTTTTSVSTAASFLTSGIVAGMLVTGAGVADGTYVASGITATALVLNKATLVAGTAANLTFSYPYIGIGATGFLKVKNIQNGPFESGLLTLEGGSTPVMTATSDEITAAIEVVGADSGVTLIPRQGKFLSQGQWYSQPLAPLFTQAVTASGSAGAWTVTVTTAAYAGGAAQFHRLIVGQEVEICGVKQGLYNGKYRITAVTATTFTYTNTTAKTLSTATVQGYIRPFQCTTGEALTVYNYPGQSPCLLAGVWIEAYPGADTGNGDNSAYKHYMSLGSYTVANGIGTDVQRGKGCWVYAAAALAPYFKVGSDLASTPLVHGYLPVPGCKIRYGNIFTSGITAGTPQTNTVQTTPATRFKFDTTKAGYINVDKSHLYWQPTFAQPYYVGLTNTTIVDTLIISEIGSAVAWDNIMVGQSAVLATNNGLNLQTCFAGGTIQNSKFSSAVSNSCTTSGTAVGASPLVLINVDGFAFTNCDSYGIARAGTATCTAALAAPYPDCAIYTQNATNTSFTSHDIHGAGRIYVNGGFNITATNTTFTHTNGGIAYNNFSPYSVTETVGKAKDIMINGLDWVGSLVTTMSCTTNVVTCTTNPAHGYAASTVVDIIGCNLPDYNAHSVTLSLVTVAVTATTANGSNQLTASATLTGMQVGWIVTGTGIPAGTFVQAIISTSLMIISKACTAGAAVTCTFTDPYKFTYPKTAANVGATAQTTMKVNIANVNAPMTAILSNNNCDNIKVRNIGSYYSKLNLGTTSASNFPAYIYFGNAGTSGINVELKRIYTSSPRTGVCSEINSLSKVTVENVHCGLPYEMVTAPTGFRGNTSILANLSGTHKGCGWWHTIPTQTQGVSVYGTHFLDNHISATESQIHIIGNEASPSTVTQIAEDGTNSSASGFNSGGAFVMPKVNDAITWTLPYKVIGHTGTQVAQPGLMNTTTIGTASIPGTAANLTVTAASWAALTITVTTANTSPVLTSIANTDVLWVGASVSGTGIAVGATIISVDSATQVTLSLPCTASAAVAMTYSGEISLTAGTHMLAVGDTIFYTGTAGPSSNWYGVYTVSGITSATVFRCKRIENSGGTTPTAGTISVPYLAISSFSWAANLTTVVTSFAHGLQPGDTVVIQDCIPTGTIALNNVNGEFAVVSTPTLTSFTFTAAASPGTTSATGTIRPCANIKLTYDVGNTGTFKNLLSPIHVCSTASAANGVVACPDTSNVAVGDWVFGNNIAAGGALVTAVSPNTSFTLGRNNVTVAGGASTTVSNFTCYSTKFPNQIIPAANVGLDLKVRAITLHQSSVAQISNISMNTSSTRVSQAYLYPLETVSLKITCLSATDGTTPVVGARVYMTAGATGGATPGTVIMQGITDSSGILTATGYELLSTTQSVSGRVRQGSSAPHYKTSPISGNITASGLDITVFMVGDD